MSSFGVISMPAQGLERPRLDSTVTDRTLASTGGAVSLPQARPGDTGSIIPLNPFRVTIDKCGQSRAASSNGSDRRIQGLQYPLFHLR